MIADKFLTAEEVAERLGVTDRTVRNMVLRGSFPNAFKLDPTTPRSSWRIPEADVIRLEQMRRGQVEPEKKES